MTVRGMQSCAKSVKLVLGRRPVRLVHARKIEELEIEKHAIERQVET